MSNQMNHLIVDFTGSLLANVCTESRRHYCVDFLNPLFVCLRHKLSPERSRHAAAAKICR